MTHGKNICNQLKEVRKRIAEENDIPLEIEECSYKGECRGTCPRCEAEVRYLENALADRLRLGKVATVAGLVLGLAGTTTYAAESTPNKSLPVLNSHHETYRDTSIETDSVKVRGTVIDVRTQEELPFATVIVTTINSRDTVARTATDFEGRFELVLPKGQYSLSVYTIGYQRWSTWFTANEETNLGDITLVAPTTGLVEVEIIQGMPIQDVVGPDLIGPNGSTQEMEVDGVKVIVR